jgi:predicted RNA-binding protein YlxR (DUF448 family)
MIRLKAKDDRIIVSSRNDKTPGRGCYACPDEKCVELALKRGSLARALRRKIVVPPSKEALLKGHEKKGYLDDHVDR